MFCRFCGQALAAGAEFCSQCGKAVTPGVSGAAQNGGAPWDGLYRPLHVRRMAGVCAALALRYRWDLTATRLLTLIFGFVLFPFTEIAYVVGWMVLPEERPQPPVG